MTTSAEASRGSGSGAERAAERRGQPTSAGWLTDVALGGPLGAVVGAIVAVNIVIFAGPDQGYESSLRDLFEHNALVGLVIVACLASGPLLGIGVARALRHRAATSAESRRFRSSDRKGDRRRL